MSRYMTLIEFGRHRNLDMRQFISLRFTNLILCNFYVLDRYLHVDQLLHNDCSFHEEIWSAISSFYKAWKIVPLCSFVSRINYSIAQDGVEVLLLDLFQSDRPTAHEPDTRPSTQTSVDSNITTVSQRKPWPKRSRQKLADVESLKSQRLSTAWPHEMRHGSCQRPCAACTS